jgi:hypothetical protein
MKPCDGMYRENGSMGAWMYERRRSMVECRFSFVLLLNFRSGFQSMRNRK